MNPQLLEKLKAGALHFNLSLTPPLLAQFNIFLNLLKKWTRHYNLTSITDPTDILIRHFLDSLAIAPYVTGNRILDIGSGAGFPGIPLALVFPQKHFVLLDSRAKKTAFLTQAIQELKLVNTEIVTSRVERYIAPNFDVMMCRAFGSINKIIQQTQHLIAQNGVWLFMKGKYPKEELKALSYFYEIYPLKIPGLDEERHLVVVKQKAQTCQPVK